MDVVKALLNNHHTFEGRMDKSPHWPGVGRYVGEVCDGPRYWFDVKGGLSWSEVQDDHDFQKRRVYQDELDYINANNL